MISPDTGVKFENVAGIDEAKEEIRPSIETCLSPLSFPVFKNFERSKFCGNKSGQDAQVLQELFLITFVYCVHIYIYRL